MAGERDLPGVGLDERRDAIERSVAEIAGATGPEIQARLRRTGALGADSPMLAAIVLQAGRELPPGLSAARRAQRQTRAAEALAWLRKGLEQPASAAATRDALALILGEGPGGSARNHPMPEVARAAMNVAAALDLLEFAPAIGAFLDAGPTVAATARGALLRMTGRSIDTAAEFKALWPRLAGLGPAALGRDALLAATERADALAIRLLEFAPDALEGEPLAFTLQGSVALGSAAVVRSVAGRKLPPDRALRWLGDGLEDEARPRAFAARLSAMCDLIQGADPDSEAARFVSRRVQGLLAQGRALHPELAWATVSTLPRLVLPAAEPAAGPEAGDAVRERLLTQGLALLVRCVDADRFRPHDPDGLQGALTALIDLARSIEDDDLRASAARPLVERLMAFVTTELPLPPSVRRTAASGLPLSLRPEDALVLIGLVESLATPELEYELLGALRAAFAVLPPGGDDAEGLLSRLFEISSADNFDRKMRALVVLASEDAAVALAAKSREMRSRWLLKRFENETETEVHRAFLGILARIGDGGVLEQLTEQPERLRLIAAQGGNEETMEAFESTVRALAAEDPDRMRRAAAETLAAGFVGQSSRRPEDFALLRSGLRLALEADALGVDGASINHHALIVRAALELLRLEPVAGVAALDVATLVRIRVGHLVPLAQVTSDLYGFETAAAEALISARLGLREPDLGVTPVQVVAAYGAALRAFGASAPRAVEGEANGEQGSGGKQGSARDPYDPSAQRFGWSAAALEIDAIGYLRAAESGTKALARIDAWLAGRPAAIGPVPASVQRTYCELALNGAALDPEQLTLARAARVLDHLDSLSAKAESEGADAASPSLATWLTATVADERPGMNVLARVASSTDSERYRSVMDRVASLGGDRGEEGEEDDGGTESSEGGG